MLPATRLLTGLPQRRELGWVPALCAPFAPQIGCRVRDHFQSTPDRAAIGDQNASGVETARCPVPSTVADRSARGIPCDRLDAEPLVRDRCSKEVDLQRLGLRRLRATHMLIDCDAFRTERIRVEPGPGVRWPGLKRDFPGYPGPPLLDPRKSAVALHCLVSRLTNSSHPK